MTAHRWFLVGCVIELALLALAAGLGAVIGQPLFASWRWSAMDAGAGVAGVVPMGILFWWALHSKQPPLVEIRDILEQFLRPIMKQWSIAELFVISLLAGVAEESLFRGAIQGGLEQRLPSWLALLAASVLFGLGHAATWAYGVIAGVIGAFLGAVWLLTANLLCPVVSHALYDFLALIYLLRVHPPREPLGGAWTAPL